MILAQDEARVEAALKRAWNATASEGLMERLVLLAMVLESDKDNRVALTDEELENGVDRVAQIVGELAPNCTVKQAVRHIMRAWRAGR